VTFERRPSGFSLPRSNVGGNIGQSRILDTQRSWSKAKSLTEKKKPAKQKPPVETSAALAADAKASDLDGLLAEEQLVAATIPARQVTPVRAEAVPYVTSVADRFAKADEGRAREGDGIPR